MTKADVYIGGKLKKNLPVLENEPDRVTIIVEYKGRRIKRHKDKHVSEIKT